MAIDFGSMPVPGASSFLNLQDQVSQETDEQRKKRLAANQLSQRTGMSLGASSLMNSTGYGSALGSLGAAGIGR